MGAAVVLVGPMGVGKTTIGKKLAKQLGKSFLDTDKEIVKQHGSIAKIFEKSGEQHFRALETEFLLSALASDSVVATGGGVVTQERNRDALRDSFVIYLSTNGRHIASRLLAGRRPLLKNGIADWKRIYEERKPFYQQVATVEIETSSKALNSVVSEIVELVNSRG
ncbi:MAG: AAA family ATPase [Actinobacteria bacterium]|jgi:shikimate kinase|uniref:shikimate kinase n=1 Tax=freshwater metagenome TaxID=449393 RepID=A0A6J6LJT8_9ZZZZ|nr:AAA family ATPase [Actinomycetota bacterium]